MSQIGYKKMFKLNFIQLIFLYLTNIILFHNYYLYIYTETDLVYYIIVTRIDFLQNYEDGIGLVQNNNNKIITILKF